MPNYVLAFHGGKYPETPEEGAGIMARWEAWMGSLGDALVNPGNPLAHAKTLSSDGVTDGGGSNPLTGFSVVAADDMEAALAMARGCPHLEFDGTIEVAEAMRM